MVRCILQPRSTGQIAARGRLRPRRRGQLRALALTVLLTTIVTASFCASPAVARRAKLRLIDDGRGLLHSYSATMGVIYNRSGDFTLWSQDKPITVQARGVRYYERNGFITGTILAIVRIFSAAAASAGPKSYETWREGNYRYTRTTYYSAQEKAAMRDAASSSAARMLTSPGQSFDLEIYSRSLGGDSSGYRMTMMMGGMKFGRGNRGLFDAGLRIGSVTSAAAADGEYLITTWNSFGIPLRVSYAVGPFNLYGSFVWNWFGHTRGGDITGSWVGPHTRKAKVAGFPLQLGVTTTLLSRIYLEAAATTPSPTSGVFGFVASAGARF